MAESACPNCGAPVKNLIDTRERRCYAFVDETAGLRAQLAEAQHQADLSRVAMACADVELAHESEKRELERRLAEAAELALRLSCEVGRLRRLLQEEEADVAALRARLAAAERALDDELSAEREELALAHEALDRAGVADDEMGLPLAVRLAELVARAERQAAGAL